MNRYERADAIYFASAINWIPVDQNCAFEFIKTVRTENGHLIVEYTNEDLEALKLPIPIMDKVIDFLNKWNDKNKITHIKNGN